MMRRNFLTNFDSRLATAYEAAVNECNEKYPAYEMHIEKIAYGANGYPVHGMYGLWCREFWTPEGFWEILRKYFPNDTDFNYSNTLSFSYEDIENMLALMN